MLLKTAAEILTKNGHRESGWYIPEGRDDVVYGDLCSDFWLTAFEAVAVAEKYERETPPPTDAE